MLVNISGHHFSVWTPFCFVFSFILDTILPDYCNKAKQKWIVGGKTQSLQPPTSASDIVGHNNKNKNHCVWMRERERCPIFLMASCGGVFAVVNGTGS